MDKSSTLTPLGEAHKSQMATSSTQPQQDAQTRRMLEEKLLQRERFTERLLRQTLAQDGEIRHLKADAKIRDERLTALHSENIRLRDQIAAQYQQAGDRHMVGLRRMSKCSVTVSMV